jgi:hypothetical protein
MKTTRIKNLLKRLSFLNSQLWEMREYDSYRDWDITLLRMGRVESTLNQYPQRLVDEVKEEIGFSF